MHKMSLTQARELLGWSQSQLSREAGLNNSAVRDIERKRIRRPAYASVMAIVTALQRGGLTGLKAEDIFGGPDSEREAVAP
jgi:transcriptional regulator with XRE-family HTH domain